MSDATLAAVFAQVIESIADPNKAAKVIATMVAGQIKDAEERGRTALIMEQRERWSSQKRDRRATDRRSHDQSVSGEVRGHDHIDTLSSCTEKKEDSIPCPEKSADKRTVPVSMFGEFWAAYPKKTAKEAARKAWAKAVKAHGPEAELFAKVAKALDWQRRSEQWSGPKYIPNPATYLNNGCWEDEQPELFKKQPQAPRPHVSRFTE